MVQLLSWIVAVCIGGHLGLPVGLWRPLTYLTIALLIFVGGRLLSPRVCIALKAFRVVDKPHCFPVSGNYRFAFHYCFQTLAASESTVRDANTGDPVVTNLLDFQLSANKLYVVIQQIWILLKVYAVGSPGPATERRALSVHFVQSQRRTIRGRREAKVL